MHTRSPTAIRATRAARWAEVPRLRRELKHAGNQAARRYLDGEIDADAAAAYLTRYGLVQPDRARKQIKFVDVNRSYVINYNLGEDLVRAWIEEQAAPKSGDGDGDGAASRRWTAFEKLISSPMTAGEISR